MNIKCSVIVLRQVLLKHEVMIRRIIFLSSVLCSLLLLTISCKEDEIINNIPVADFTIHEGLDEITLTDKSIDEDRDLLTYQWKTDSKEITLSNTTLPETFFRIPALENPLDITVELKVSDATDETAMQKIVTIPILTEVRSFGLGMESGQEVDNDAKYDWYIDQMNTGSYSLVNCGPASVTMAIKWADSLFTGTSQDARNMYHPNGGWWYTNDIIGYLNQHSINNFVIALDGMSVVTREIDKGNIAILCLDMYLIKDEEKGRWHIDKFYRTDDTGWGHFIVVKGYRVVDNKLFLEAYDPYGFGRAYNDGAPKGKNRYYREDDIENSAGIWWNYAIIVSRDKGKGVGALDPSTIVHQHGGH